MDAYAYDHIQEENFPGKENTNDPNKAAETQSNLNQEFQDAYKDISSSPWGTKLVDYGPLLRNRSGRLIPVYSRNVF